MTQESKQRPQLIEVFDGGDQSSLESTLTDMPWGDGWTLLHGIDAISGVLSVNSAIKPAAVTRARMDRALYSGNIISSEEKFTQEIEVNLNTKFNIGSVDVTASSKFLQKVTFSELSLSIVVRYRVEPTGYDVPENIELTDEARALLRDPVKFRQKYGDYFIAGVRRSSEFIAVYNLRSTSSEKIREFEAGIGVVSSLLTVEGTARLKDAVSKYDMTVDCSVDYVGNTTAPAILPTTPDEILKALEWFKDNNEGIAEVAMLKNYSYFDVAYPTTVDVPPDVFSDLHMLYRKLWVIRAYHFSLPKHYKEKFADQVLALELEISTDKSGLPKKAEKRHKLSQRASDLRADLKEVIERRDFFDQVRQTVGAEPAKGKDMSAAKSQYTWTYGYVTYPGSIAVTISAVKREFKESSRMGWREATLEINPAEGALVVGWEVRSNWRDNTNGKWWKVSDTILGKKSGQIHVKSAHLRGCDWTVIFYTVPEKDYIF